MGKLKQQNVTQCLRILEDFIGGVKTGDEGKGIAMLALHHLESITGCGDTDNSSLYTTTSGDPTCTSRPRADLSE